ncbi:MAG TPA: spore coat U domain-containing protein [Rhizomicrobium sp.]|jgi:spore coat protein U-like protein|nr:spore coat U domain-containing protein [Rhizomicrobium sp.]
MKSRTAFLTAFTLLTATPAMAATCGGVLNPVLVVPTAVSFGLYQPGSSDTPANGSIAVSCTVTLGSALPTFTIAISSGNAHQFTPRQMSFLGTPLNYNLYTTGSFGQIWGDGTAPSVTQSYSAGAAQTTFTVYGLIPHGQFVAPGLYSDGVTVTVTF